MDKYGIQMAQFPLDNEAFKTTPVPTNAEFELLCVPDAPNMSVEVLNIGITWAQIPIDGTDPVTVTINFHDKSAGTNTSIVTAFNCKSTNASLVARECTSMFPAGPSSLQRMDSGDSLDAVFATTSPDTAGLGGTITVLYRVKEWNGE